MNDNIYSWFNPLGMRISTAVIISLVVLVALLSFRCKRRLRCLTNRSSFSLGMVGVRDSEMTIYTQGSNSALETYFYYNIVLTVYD